MREGCNLQDLLKYIWDILKKSPTLRPLVALLRLGRTKLRTSIKTHPYFVIALLGCVVAFIIFNPQYSPYVPAGTCGLIDIAKGKLYNEKGDELHLNGKRPCESQEVQAIEFFNTSDVDLEGNNKFVHAVSAGLFVKETAVGVKNKSQWHEYTLFTKSNDFVWKALDPQDNPIQQYGFDKGECQYTKTVDHQNVDTETRQGVVIRSPDFRSDPSQTYDQWKFCNYGQPGKKGFESCKYLTLDFFLPIGTPAQGCPVKSAADIWFGVGTKKSLFIDPQSYSSLSKLAQDRWIPERIKPVPENEYRKLTTSSPKICLRWVSLDGKNIGPWEEFATVPALWCDL
ncbi:hypothetical protein [Rhizobium ruizarguesonis]|uniref:hypothetical protein n=1 Tax=Rhizobium ruizarguesonis TaxID=2081791 RepID=UPI00102FF0C3|nr:hypothetical protein [Rhizobium ruizarguesonis]TBC68338.1 hypothetical protein ELH28_38115 [Rhizobium ruizarguesonis]TBD93679.1 hypothetical protein ELH10_35100 [Rhizobium ruizarguesonis]TBF03679.1 hypothetical protein ELG95_32825 [Rhizobium ruizarguesonis]